MTLSNYKGPVTVFSILLILSLLVFSVPPMPVQAADYVITAAYDNMTAASGAFQLNENATIQAGPPSYIQLTPKAGGCWGSAFRKNKVVMPSNYAFSSYFQFRIDPGSRADGLVFVIQGSTNTVGGAGGDLGTLGIYPMWGIEFDTFNNGVCPGGYGDPNNNHIAIIHGQPSGILNAKHCLPGQKAPVSVALELANNVARHCWIEYDGSTVTVRMGLTNDRGAATVYLTQADNLASLFTSRDMYFGFTAATGGSFSEHCILSCYFNNAATPVIDLSANTYSSGPATITLTSTPASLPANSTTQICALVKNELGAVMAGQTVNFTTTSGTFSAASAVTNASGIACVNLTGPGAAGTSTVRGTHTAGAYGETTVTWTAPTPTPTPIPTPTPNPLVGAGTSHGASTGTPGTFSYSPPATIPNIQVQSAGLSEKTVTPGTPVMVTADIANRSTANGSKKVTLYVNGQVESTQGITVNSGGSSKLSFSVSRSEPGDYSVYVDGVPAGSFKVELFRESDGILIFSAVLVALAFLVGVVMLWRRQRYIVSGMF